MALADDEARRTSFGTLVDADAYDGLRPGYPREAVAWLVGDDTGGDTGGGDGGGDGGGRRPLRVLDLAAGTGKVTRVLLELGHEVVAVDPSEAMLGALRRSVAGSPGAGRAQALVGSAEALPLPDASVDAVTVGQAWHWVRPAAAVAEVVRVLRPGGVLGLAWNARDLSVPWARALEDLVSGTGVGEAAGGEEAPRGTGGGSGPADDPADPADPAGGGWWPRVPGMPARERRDVPAVQRLASPEDVVALAATHSGIAVRTEEEDREGVLARVRALAAAAAEPDGSVVVPLVCHCFRYRRP